LKSGATVPIIEEASMTSFRRLAVPLVGAALALGASGTAWFTEAGAAAVPAATPTPPGPQPHGVNFTIHSSIDPNFCVEDTPSIQNPTSGAIMSQCIIRDNQRWTFANGADGSVVIVGGNGNCLDFTAKDFSPVSVTPCTFKVPQHFFYTPSGQIESTNGKKCLESAQAAQNADMFIAKCDSSVKAQIWQLGH
jgi:Ricin-type beta-trefoil lectin domain